MDKLLYVVLGMAIPCTGITFYMVSNEDKVLAEKRALAIYTSFTSCMIGVHKFHGTDKLSTKYCVQVSNWYSDVWSN